MKPTNLSKFAFTLAEVLITLGIIGVVAALTLPAVISNTQNKQLESGLKKGASVIEQALNMYQAEYGDKIAAGNIPNEELKPLLMKYMNVVKDCGYGHSDADKACIKNYGSGNSENSTYYKNYNGTSSIDNSLFDEGQFVLADGSLILIQNSAQTDLLYISIDVNGFNKRPNRLGQDLFMFYISDKGQLLPMGAEGTNFQGEAYCAKTSTNSMNGAGCTYKALSEADYFKTLPK